MIKAHEAYCCKSDIALYVIKVRIKVIIYFPRSGPISLKAVEVIIHSVRPRSISLQALEAIIYFGRGR